VTLPPGSTCSELRGQDGDPSTWRALVGGHQLEWRGTPPLYQHKVGDLLLVVVPRHGYRGQLTTGCTLMNPLGAEAVCRPELLSGWRDAYVLGKFSR
jgi:hypothetical protein